MEPGFWRSRWQKQEIGFHQADYHGLLLEHWADLKVPSGTDVFVPLCGKSLDMVWLAEQGHRVIGAELSELAVDAFFAERGLIPDVRTEGVFTVKSAGPYEIWCGDFFEMPSDALRNVAGVFDRAALIALPPGMQQRYAEKIAEIVPTTAPMLIITLEYDPAQMSGPPFTTPRVQVHNLYDAEFDVQEIDCRDVMETHPHFAARGLTSLEECAFVLRRR
ncbi:thiopurine S-methyltransferase [Hyphomicrobium sp. D-2]|uniref:thiopurine S-methyltransferase n=1 Tax=Hyphomicrobium sp. D-2 TaxID=3041621 RepID=UPI002457FCFF|nr:thiopurine S-methyltransferase [Hyphomicrobium sp. D-2]MDH4983521.1 thiopurine S-methyltransferase [Hyphomicrobium sp. D-2]